MMFLKSYNVELSYFKSLQYIISLIPMHTNYPQLKKLNQNKIKKKIIRILG
jgi:hypothetical protein